MNCKKLINFLQEFNNWRRGAKIPQPNPTDVGRAIDEACKKLSKLKECTNDDDCEDNSINEISSDKRSLRAYYLPDKKTTDWPIYFYLDRDREKWIMDKDCLFTYPTSTPLIDPNWIIEEYKEKKWVRIFG